MSYICLNGQVIEAEALDFNIFTRGFLYGDGFFESIYFHGTAPLLNYHLNRIKRGNELFEFDIHNDLLNESFLNDLFSKLCELNKLKFPVRIRLSIWRKGASLYIPTETESNYWVEAIPILKQEDTLKIGVYNKKIKPLDDFSELKKLGNTFYVKAGLWCKQNNFNECLIFNHLNQVIETLYSNIFIINSGIVYQTPMGNGAVAGVMKNALSENLPQWGFDTQTMDLDLQTIMDADEMFLSNGIRGIQTVEFFNGKKYETKTGKEIQAQVEQKWF